MQSTPSHSAPIRPVLLIVDSSQLIRELLAIALADCFSPVTAGDFFEAQEALKREPILIITDHHLRGGTGFNLYCDVRKGRPDLPFILFCQDAPVSALDRACRVVSKPFHLEQLYRAILSLLRSSAHSGINLQSISGCQDPISMLARSEPSVAPVQNPR